MRKNIYFIVALYIGILCMPNAYAQGPTSITETFGTGVGTITAYEAANSFDTDWVTYSGTGTVQSTSASSGYSGASGGSNVALLPGQNLTLLGLDPQTCTQILLSFGLRGIGALLVPSTNLILYYTTDGTTWIQQSYVSVPGTSWQQVPTIPLPTNVKGIRFTNTLSTGSVPFRIDDIKIVANCALPVTYASFTASLTDAGKVKLNWATSWEKLNEFFQVERSENGVNYEGIGKVQGSGNTSGLTRYTFIDEITPATVLYYRLKQVDIDGQFAYSRTIAISAEKTGSLRMYPNPTGDQISFSGLYGTVSKVVVRSLTGKEVAHFGALQTISIANLQPGIYMVEILTSSGERIVKRVVKQ